MSPTRTLSGKFLTFLFHSGDFIVGALPFTHILLPSPRKLDHWLGSSPVLRWALQEGAMTRKRHTEEQIIAVLKDAQAGIGVQELCRKHGISDATLYKWRAKYAGLEVSDVKKLRQLEDENRRLKQMVAEQALDIQALKAINAKNW